MDGSSGVARTRRGPRAAIALERVTGDGDDVGAAFRGARPRRGEVAQGQRSVGRVTVDGAARRARERDVGERGELRGRELGAVRVVFGERVVGLPRLEVERELEHRRPGELERGEVLAAQHALVHRQGRARSAGYVRREVRPTMGRRDDLGQRSEREPAGALDEHRGCERAVCLQAEPVLGVGRDRPQLATGRLRAAASIAQRHERCPVARRGQPVDHAEELVEVGASDGFVEVARRAGVAGRRGRIGWVTAHRRTE